MKNKDILKTSKDESYLLEPFEIQDFIDQLSEQFWENYIFVRPLGTEDAVRYYIETKDSNNLKKLEHELLTFLENY